MRLDKWIWSVCLVKNRTLATALCRLGKVLVNGDEGKAAKIIKVDDIIEIKGSKYCKVKVKQFASKPIKKEIAPLEYYESIEAEKIQTSTNPNQPANNKFRDFKYKTQKDGKVSKKDKRARAKVKEFI